MLNQDNPPLQEETDPIVILPADDKTLKWQKSLLPLMKKMIIGTSIFFFVISFGQLIYLHIKILKPDNGNVLRSLSEIGNTNNLSFEQRMDAVKFKTTFLLENEALQRRHHQSNVLLMSRTWIKYLGFVTGMILALVGAVFILGKLEEISSALTAKTADSAFTLNTTSPGIFLAVLGTALMLSTIFTNHTIEVHDAQIYINGYGGSSSTSETTRPILPKPKTIEETDRDTVNKIK